VVAVLGSRRQADAMPANQRASTHGIQIGRSNSPKRRYRRAMERGFSQVWGRRTNLRQARAAEGATG
jgi:hypothetical protein